VIKPDIQWVTSILESRREAREASREGRYMVRRDAPCKLQAAADLTKKDEKGDRHHNGKCFGAANFPRCCGASPLLHPPIPAPQSLTPTSHESFRPA